MKRYDLVHIPYESQNIMIDSKEGEWVKWEDVAELLKDNEWLRQKSINRSMSSISDADFGRLCGGG